MSNDLQVMTFDDFPTVNTVADLADAILLNRVMNAVYVERVDEVQCGNLIFTIATLSNTP